MVTGTNESAPSTDPVPVAVFAPTFPPAFRGGGPIRSLEAMVARAPAGFAAYVLTSDRDLGETEPLPVERNRWIAGPHGATYYATLSSLRALLRAMFQLRERQPRMLYLNSFFNRPMTMVPVLLWRIGFWGRPVLILAPRGEFGDGALTRRTIRKRVWIALFRALRIHRSTLWHVTADFEAEAVRRMWGDDAAVVLRENETLLPKVALEPEATGDEAVRLVFLGRVTELKGAAVALRALQECAASVSFDVYGPPEDAAYLETCEELADRVPANVKVRFHGGVEHRQVQQTLRDYEMFLYPTAGENFGHVLAEALSSSCVVATTDTTPWTGVLRDGAGFVVSDRTPQAWLEIIETFAQLSSEERLAWRKRAGSLYTQWAHQPRPAHLWALALEHKR